MISGWNARVASASSRAANRVAEKLERIASRDARKQNERETTRREGAAEPARRARG